MREYAYLGPLVLTLAFGCSADPGGTGGRLGGSDIGSDIGSDVGSPTDPQVPGTGGAPPTSAAGGASSGTDDPPVAAEGVVGTGSGEAGTDPGCVQPSTDAVVEGRVFAPNLEIPISGALVYLTRDAVAPVPDAVYCAECVELSCGVPFVLTESDGSFSLPAVSGPGQQLVVQKGQFLHVEPLEVVPGSNAVPAMLSNLPGEWNPTAGKWIPRIAVYETNPDKVYNVLAKFGLGEVDGSGNLIRGTEQFTLISDSDEGAFMDDLTSMNRYHIIFLPCAATKYWSGAPTVSPARAQNIRDYVEAGGKWYATDHSNEYIKEPFPSYQDFHSPSMPDIQPSYSVSGTVVDTDLLAWLSALPPSLQNIGGGNPDLLGLPAVTLTLNYSGLDATHDVIVQDEDGNDVNVGHHTWVEGPCTSCSDPNVVRPMAVSGSYGCGRMMYSTFETSSSAHVGLNPQELVLLYMILEIGVCRSEPPPPPVVI